MIYVSPLRLIISTALSWFVLTQSVYAASSIPHNADWAPQFNPTQHVYVDPALQQNPTAPIRYSDALIEAVNKAQAASKVQFYVVATETNQLPGQRPLSQTKTSEFVQRWGSLPTWPKQQSALIVFYRRADNYARTGLGVNLSSDLNWIPKDNKAIVHKYLPKNSEGAIIAQVGSIANQVIAQQQAPVAIGLFVLIVFVVGAVIMLASYKEDLDAAQALAEALSAERTKLLHELNDGLDRASNLILNLEDAAYLDLKQTRASAYAELLEQYERADSTFTKLQDAHKDNNQQLFDELYKADRAAFVYCAQCSLAKFKDPVKPTPAKPKPPANYPDPWDGGASQAKTVNWIKANYDTTPKPKTPPKTPTPPVTSTNIKVPKPPKSTKTNKSSKSSKSSSSSSNDWFINIDYGSSNSNDSSSSNDSWGSSGSDSGWSSSSSDDFGSWGGDT